MGPSFLCGRRIATLRVPAPGTGSPPVISLLRQTRLPRRDRLVLAYGWFRFDRAFSLLLARLQMDLQLLRRAV